MAKVGLVTVLFKCNDVLEDFFKSLSAQSFHNYHLYIIDNSPSAETDALLTHLISRFSIPAITHVKNPQNYGVAKGNNQGIELSIKDKADFILLLNNDIYFSQPFLLEEMINCAVKQNESMIIPKILFYGTRKIWMAGGRFIHYKGVSKNIGKFDDDSEFYNNAGYFNYAPTCFMLISSKVFEAVGFMDERYFVYYDDNDFVMRAIKKGFKIYFMPSLEVFHKVSVSTGGHESLFSIYYLNRNRIYFIRKHYSSAVKYIALTHAILTKSMRSLFYNKDKRKQLFKGFRDGFSMKVHVLN